MKDNTYRSYRYKYIKLKEERVQLEDRIKELLKVNPNLSPTNHITQRLFQVAKEITVLQKAFDKAHEPYPDRMREREYDKVQQKKALRAQQQAEKRKEERKERAQLLDQKAQNEQQAHENHLNDMMEKFNNQGEME